MELREVLEDPARGFAREWPVPVGALPALHREVVEVNFATCCILSYNRPQFLATAISTLRENAGAPFELIIHDDGSTDPDVYQVLGEAHAAGATVITNALGHNQGQGVALNRMFSMAKGDPIIKLDQDLTFNPGWLAHVQQLLGENRAHAWHEPRIGLLGLLHYHHDPVDCAKTILNTWPPMGSELAPTLARWEEHTHILGSGFALRRETWDALGPFEEHSEAFAEDWSMQMKVTERGGWCCALPIEDLVVNHGMGIGPSTVVVGDGVVQSIHRGPYIHE